MGDSPDDENFDPPRILFPDKVSISAVTRQRDCANLPKSSDDLATSLSEPEMNSSEGQTQHDVVPSVLRSCSVCLDDTYVVSGFAGGKHQRQPCAPVCSLSRFSID